MLKTKRKLIISLHGIRTRGTWQKELSPLITEQGWIYYPLDYGWFSLLFFIPGVFRKRKIEWFRAQYNEIHSRYPDVIPSIVAHSFGTWTLCKAIEKYEHLRFDKIILCGSIAPHKFDWRKLYHRNQVTAIRNESGKRDIWARFSKFFAWGTGDSGFRGFAQKETFIVDREYPEYDHGSVFGYDHYLGEWIPFFGQIRPFADGKFPADSEEPVSPYDAARWSAITYQKQYISRLAEAFQRDEVFSAGAGGPLTTAKRLVVLIPRTPGEASHLAAGRYYADNRFEPIFFGRPDQRTAHLGPDRKVYDIPTTLHSLLSLDRRTDEELVEAVKEFAVMLQKLIDHPASDVKGVVEIVRL